MCKYYIKSINSNSIIYQGFFNKNLMMSIMKDHLDNNKNDEIEYGLMVNNETEPISTYKNIKTYLDVTIEKV